MGSDVKLTFIIKSVDSVDGSTLVVSSQQEEVLRILDLVSQQQTDGLQTLFTCEYKHLTREII